MATEAFAVTVVAWGCGHLPKPCQLLGGGMAFKRNLKLWTSNVLLEALPEAFSGDREPT